MISAARARTMLGIVLTSSLLIFALHAVGVRPYLWPAGAGLTVSGDTVYGAIAEPRAVPRIRPPHITDTELSTVVVTRVVPGSDAARAGITRGMRVALPDTVESALLSWRERYRAGPSAPQTLIHANSDGETFRLSPRAAWQLDPVTRNEWMRAHLGAILQMAAFLSGACILAALGTTGMTALLMTLALVFTAIANSGPLLGAELQLPLVGEALLLFAWLATPLSFPIIGFAVLYFPSRAPMLDRRPWVAYALPLLPLPVLVVSLTTAVFLLGVDAAVGPVAWFARNGWLFDASFALALLANVLIVVEGIYRYRTTLDANERRRIQIVVYTGVPAVFAYAIKAGAPLVTSLMGRRLEFPFAVEALLQAVVLLPAFALPYAVAVKHVFSPRTVLRRSLQYALARRTLSVLIVLPLAALLISLASERNRPLADIILGQPLFYALTLGLLAIGLKYRDAAQRALDKRFFRAEYDAREILVALANRVPYDHDPAKLVATVITDIDNALHPESIAVLAGGETRLEVLSGRRTNAQPLARDSGVVTLLQWSDEPLEIFLDDERSPAARLPDRDRAWLAEAKVSLVVPIFASGGGGGADRSLIGVIALGQKRSEEPYTPEDQRLLSGIATQMSVALDLSRLRKQAASGSLPLGAATPTLTPTMVAHNAPPGPPALVMCPACHRCFDAVDVRTRDGSALCPDDKSALQPVIGMPPIVDGKYRVEAVVGRGGMGAVFRARDLRLQRDVALKVVRAELVSDPDSRERFHREAQIVAQLQHPAIVTVFDFGSLVDGAAFLVMEYVRGEDLRRLLKRQGSLSPSHAVELMIGIARGVDAAHRAGVLHRDLKPENILLPQNGMGPKVLDFGVAKVTGTGTGGAGMSTHAGTIIGTPAYMAPEQLRGAILDPRADIYSLAVMTFEAVSGRLPFGTGSFIDLAVRQNEGTDIVNFDGVPEGLAVTLKRALSLTREARPATAAQFAEELRLSL